MDKTFSVIKQRLIDYIDNKGITKESFFKKTGISASNFKGKGALSEIGGENIAKILTEYPDLNPEWLLTGNGEMFKRESNPGYYTAVSGNDNRFGNITQGDRNVVGEPQTTRLEKGETEMLRKEISHLNDMLKEKERALEEKERLIQILLKK